MVLVVPVSMEYVIVHILLTRLQVCGPPSNNRGEGPPTARCQVSKHIPCHSQPVHSVNTFRHLACRNEFVVGTPIPAPVI